MISFKIKNHHEMEMQFQFETGAKDTDLSPKTVL
jgi:hypothetical protein